MKRYLGLLLFLLTSVCSFAQLNGDGYYRVQNYGSKRWAYLRDDYGWIDMGSQQADCGAIILFKNKPLLDDPSSVIYIKSMGTGQYDLTGQGTGLHKIINYYVSVADRSKYTKVENTYWVYATNKGVTKYLGDANTLNTDKAACGFDAEKADYRLWSVFKLNDTDNYLGVTPTVKANNVNYAPYYVGFPFKPAPGMKVYYVSKVDAEKGVAVMSEFTGDIVPAEMPVFLQCPGAEAKDNKLSLVVSSVNAPSGNALKGLYFNTPERLSASSKNAAVLYNEKTMRVLGVTKEGKLGFINSLASCTQYNRDKKYYLNANQAYLPVAEGTPEELTIVTEKEYEEMQKPAFIPGDANGDGQINNNDLMLIVNYLLGNVSDNFKKEGADFDGNGRVDNSDLMKVVNKILE